VEKTTKRYVEPWEVVAFVKAMMREPSVSTLFYGVGTQRDFSPQEAVVVSGFLENYRNDRAAQSLPPDYGRLSMGFTIMRKIVKGEVTGPDDPKVTEYLEKVLVAGGQ
jgi:hypothetical protein